VPLSRVRPWSQPREAVQQLLRGATLPTCTPLALVGTLLSAVNQGDALLAGRGDERVAVKLAVNFLVPFLTSSTGALLAVRRLRATPPGSALCTVGTEFPVASAERTAGPGRVVDVLIIGAGQAGLGVAYWLRRLGDLQVLVVDELLIGQNWLQRWDSLQLFTPRRFSALPGLRFPAGPTRSPSRVEMAQYLQDYVRHFSVPVETGRRVQRLSQDELGLVAHTANGVIRARQVVLATGPFRRPFVPDAGRGLSSDVRQLPSLQYRRPEDLPPGKVLVVGGGNSAAQLALELQATHSVTIASPGPLWFLPEDIAGISMYWWTLFTGVLQAPADAWASRYVRRRGDAIVGTQLRRLVAVGQVRLHPHRVVAGRDREVELEDGTMLSVSSVLWCTGFRPDIGLDRRPGSARWQWGSAARCRRVTGARAALDGAAVADPAQLLEHPRRRP